MPKREITRVEVITSGAVFGIVVTILGTILGIISLVVIELDPQVPIPILVATFLKFVLLWVLFGVGYSYFSKQRLY